MERKLKLEYPEADFDRRTRDRMENEINMLKKFIGSKHIAQYVAHKSVPNMKGEMDIYLLMKKVNGPTFDKVYKHIVTKFEKYLKQGND